MNENLKHLIDIITSEKAKVLVSHFSTIGTTVAALVGLLNVRRWLKQTTINRRAEIAAGALDELETFHSKLQEMIEWDHSDSWKEWGKNFKEIFQNNFLKGKLKVHRLKEDEIDLKVKELERIARDLLKAQRYCAQTTDGDAQIHMSVEELEKNKENFANLWRAFQVKWEEANEYLTHIGLYERKLATNPNKLKSP